MRENSSLDGAGDGAGRRSPADGSSDDQPEGPPDGPAGGPPGGSPDGPPTGPNEPRDPHEPHDPHERGPGRLAEPVPGTPATTTPAAAPGVAEERFRGLLEAAPDAMVIVDDQGVIRLVNAQTEALFGYPRRELLGRPVEILVPARFHAGHVAHRASYTANRQVRPMGAGLDLHGVRRDGTEFPVEISLSPLETADGLLISAAVRDVSERKAAEAQLTALYEQQRHVALTLQRSLMGTPRQVPGLDTASRYLPATQGLGVGGDWFDLVPLGAGRVGVLVGDVMGRGLEAAAIMGQIRSAAHALARTGMEPSELMRTLDTVVGDLAGEDQLVTCCYLVIAPDTGEVTVCSAGHLPVLVAAPGEGAYALAAPVSLPLGVGDALHQQVSVAVPPGSTLALYTDGLIETPGVDIEDRLAALVGTLDTALGTTPDLEAAADRVLGVLLPGLDTHDDDVTLLLTRLPQGPLDSCAAEMTATPESVADARAHLAKTLTSWGCTDRTDDTLLLASELLTNALRHGHGAIRLRAHRTARDITVEVSDDNPHTPRPRAAGQDEESGRGLLLVDAISDEWGTRPTRHGKTIWFTLRLPHTGADPLGPHRDGDGGGDGDDGRRGERGGAERRGRGARALS